MRGTFWRLLLVAVLGIAVLPQLCDCNSIYDVNALHLLNHNNLAYHSPLLTDDTLSISISEYHHRFTKRSLVERLRVLNSTTVEFKHGIASGDPLQDKVILWTKVTPSNQDIPILVKYQVFSMDGDVVKNGEVTTTREVDYIVKVDVDGLRPNTQYQYQFSSFNDVRSAKGRTKTLPEAQANVDEVRLAFVSCSNFQAGWFNAYRDLANENFDIVVHLGDYIYEHGPREVTAGDGSTVDPSRRPRPEKELVTLEEYRLRHAQYKTDVDLQNLHVGHPFITIWDDHEFANNAFKDNASAHDPATEGNWEDRKRAAMRAYFEYLPIRPVTPDDTTRIYRSFSYGNLVDLHMLDTRIIGRDDPDADINSPNKTILGAEQEKWLFDSLQASQNRNVAWKVVGNQVVFSKLFEALGFQAFSSDTWDKYPANRAKVQNFIKSNNISDVQFLVGDAHVSYAFEVPSSFPPPSDYNPETGQGAIATEFVIPSVTSVGPALDLPAVGKLYHRLFKQSLKNLKYANTYLHGYAIATYRQDKMSMRYIYYDNVKDQSTTPFEGALVEVTRGKNSVKVLNGMAENY